MSLRVLWLLSLKLFLNRFVTILFTAALTLPGCLRADAAEPKVIGGSLDKQIIATVFHEGFERDHIRLRADSLVRLEAVGFFHQGIREPFIQ